MDMDKEYFNWISHSTALLRPFDDQRRREFVNSLKTMRIFFFFVSVLLFDKRVQVL